MTSSRSLPVLLLALLVPACGPSIATPDGGGDDVPLVSDAGDARADAPPDVPADVPADVPSDVPHGTCETMPVSDIASRQTVNFHFASTATGYLVTQGINCGAIAITRIDGTTETPVALDLSYQCICECPRPPDPTASSLRAFDASAGAPTLSWDARSLHTCTSAIDCSTRGWPGSGYQLVTTAASAPVQAGHYRATFAVFDTLPSTCTAASDGTATCNMTFSGNPSSSYGLCPAMRTVQVEFDLPPDGNLDVNVPSA